jgi:hypothetical protein
VERENRIESGRARRRRRRRRRWREENRKENI